MKTKFAALQDEFDNQQRETLKEANKKRKAEEKLDKLQISYDYLASVTFLYNIEDEENIIAT